MLIWLITVPMLSMLGRKSTNCNVVVNSQIPRILHFNYMDGMEAFLSQERLTPEYMKGCVKHHAEWQVNSGPCATNQLCPVQAAHPVRSDPAQECYLRASVHNQPAYVGLLAIAN